MLRYLIMYLYKKKIRKKFDLKIARYRGLPYSGWIYQSETTLVSCLNSPLRVASHDCVLTQRQTQNHESERDTQILLSLSLSWLCVQRCVKTQTWDATLRISNGFEGAIQGWVTTRRKLFYVTRRKSTYFT